MVQVGVKSISCPFLAIRTLRWHCCTNIRAVCIQLSNKASLPVPSLRLVQPRLAHRSHASSVSFPIRFYYVEVCMHFPTLSRRTRAPLQSFSVADSRYCICMLRLCSSMAIFDGKGRLLHVGASDLRHTTHLRLACAARDLWSSICACDYLHRESVGCAVTGVPPGKRIKFCRLIRDQRSAVAPNRIRAIMSVLHAGLPPRALSPNN